MSVRTIRMTRKLFTRVGLCLLGTGALMLPLATSADAKPGPKPVVIRGIPSTAPAANEFQLAYLASFPDGSLEPQVDKLSAGPMFASDPLIPDSNPTVAEACGVVKSRKRKELGFDVRDCRARA